MLLLGDDEDKSTETENYPEKNVEKHLGQGKEVDRDERSIQHHGQCGGARLGGGAAEKEVAMVRSCVQTSRWKMADKAAQLCPDIWKEKSGTSEGEVD